jgi:hypothetical protein
VRARSSRFYTNLKVLNIAQNSLDVGQEAPETRDGAGTSQHMARTPAVDVSPCVKRGVLPQLIWLQEYNTSAATSLQQFTVFWDRLKSMVPVTHQSTQPQTVISHVEVKEDEDIITPPHLPDSIIKDFRIVNGSDITRWLNHIVPIISAQTHVRFAGDSLEAVAEALVDAMHWLTDEEAPTVFRPTGPHAAMVAEYEFSGLQSFLTSNCVFIV